MNPGPTPELGQAAQEDTYPLGLSSDADDRPCPRQMGMPARGAVMNKYAHTARPPLAQAYVQGSDNAR